MSHVRIDLRVDIAQAAALPAPARMAATLHLPDAAPADGPLELLVCYAGAGYDRRYWDMQIEGYPGYSFAEHFVRAGRAVLAIDHLGMGDSDRPADESLLSVCKTADAGARVARIVVEGLRNGRWGLRVSRIAVTGVGHSMGAMILLTHTDRLPGFDRLALLGWTNAAIALPDSDGDLPDATLPTGYHPSPRAAMRALFYAPDVPSVVIEADEALGSLTPASLGRAAMTPGVVQAASARVAVPVLIVQGGIDISPDPHAEVAYFSGSTDVTLTIEPRAAHCHNLASTRQHLWDRIDRWIVALPLNQT